MKLMRNFYFRDTNTGNTRGTYSQNNLQLKVQKANTFIRLRASRHTPILVFMKPRRRTARFGQLITDIVPDVSSLNSSLFHKLPGAELDLNQIRNHTVLEQTMPNVSPLSKCKIWPTILICIISPWESSLTWHIFKKLCIAHVSLPYVCQYILHPFCPPQEVEHSQVVAHTLSCKHLQIRATHRLRIQPLMPHTFLLSLLEVPL